MRSRRAGNLAWKFIVSAVNLGREFRNYSPTWSSRAKKIARKKNETALTRAFAGKLSLYAISRESESGPRWADIGGKWHCWAGYVSPPWECNTYLETPDVVHRLGQISKSMEYANRRGNGTRPVVCDLHLLGTSPRRTPRKIAGARCGNPLGKWRPANIQRNIEEKEKICDNYIRNLIEIF